MISRRMLLSTGAASIVVAAGSASYLSQSAQMKSARKPWHMAGGSFGDPRLDALSYAILSPNPHNRQPWLVRLEGEDRLILTCDQDRLLPQTDPYNRQIVIGLGCFLELLRQASAGYGYALEIKLFPDGEPEPVLDERPVALVTFIKDETIEKDPLFDAVLSRRTIRTPFDITRPVSPETFQKISRSISPLDGLFQWETTNERTSTLQDICRRGWLAELKTPRTHHESTALTRIGAKEVSQNPDGISLSGIAIEATRTAGILTRENMNNTSSRAYSEVRDFYLKAISSAKAFGWLSTDGNSRIDQIKAGTSWVRLHLAATHAGLAMHPLSQVLQEFPEMSDIYEEFHDFVDCRPPRRVQGLFRFGYAKSPPPAPRWPLDSRIIAI